MTPWFVSGLQKDPGLIRGGQGLFRVLAVVCLLAACSEPAPSHAEHQSGFGAELIELGAQDLEDRAALAEATSADSLQDANLLRADSGRTVALASLIDQHGWPTTEGVGGAAVEAFFVLVRHSPSKEFQDRSRAHLMSLAEADEISRPDFAMFLDRYLVSRGKPQRYGTRFEVSNDTLRAAPIEDVVRLPALRRDAGLPLMSRYVDALMKSHKLPVAWPPQEEHGTDG